MLLDHSYLVFLLDIPNEAQKALGSAVHNMSIEIRKGATQDSIMNIRDAGNGTTATTSFKLGEWFSVNQIGLELKVRCLKK